MSLDTWSIQEYNKSSCKIKETESYIKPYIYIFVSDIAAIIVPKRELSKEDLLFIFSKFNQ